MGSGARNRSVHCVYRVHRFFSNSFSFTFRIIIAFHSLVLEIVILYFYKTFS